MTLWEQSNELIGYLGEWHTHPQRIPYPSALDLRESKKIAKLNSCIGLAMILGYDAGCAYLTTAKEQSKPISFAL